MTTLRELLTGTLRLLNVVQEGENPSDADLNIAKDTFNVMLDSWSAEKLNIYKSRPFVFGITPGKATYTLGQSADWNVPRPMDIQWMYLKYTPYNPPAPPPPPPPTGPTWSDVVLLLPTDETAVWKDYGYYYLQQPIGFYNIYNGGPSQSGTWSITTGTDDGANYGTLIYSIDQQLKNGDWTLEFDVFIDNPTSNQDFMAMFDYDPFMSLTDPVYPSNTSYCSYNNDNGYYELTLKSFSAAGEDTSIPYKWGSWTTICICQNKAMNKIFYYKDGILIAETNNVFTTSTRQVFNIPSAKPHGANRDLKPGSKLANIRYTVAALRNGTNYSVSLPYPIGSV